MNSLLAADLGAASLQDVQTFLFKGPLNILRVAIMFFDDAGRTAKLPQLRVRQGCTSCFLRRVLHPLPAPAVCLYASFCLVGDLLFARCDAVDWALGTNLPPVVAAQLAEDVEVAGAAAGDNGFTQSPIRFNDDFFLGPVDRIDGEQNPRHVGIHHQLYGGSDYRVVMSKSLHDARKGGAG